MEKLCALYNGKEHSEDIEAPEVEVLNNLGMLNAAKILKASKYPCFNKSRIKDFIKRNFETGHLDIIKEDDYEIVFVYISWNSYYYYWSETKIENYNAVPPKFVIDRLKTAKNENIFDYFTIATLKQVKDPLLIGRINNNSTRWCIAQWDNDILLDDLI